ncbi:MAG: L,D-transpeptidase family protein, partial [Bradyrhizobium sp.]
PAPTRVANAAPAAQQSDGWFSSLARKVGIGGSADATASTPPPAAPAKPKVIEAKRTEPAPRLEAAVPKTSAPKPEPKQAASRPQLKPSVSDTPAAPAAAAPAQVAGSAPIVSSNSFESRFGAVK